MLTSSGASKRNISGFHQGLLARRDIVVGAENPRTGKTIAEKVCDSCCVAFCRIARSERISFLSLALVECPDPRQVLKYMEDKLTQKAGCPKKSAAGLSGCLALLQDMQINKLLMKNQAYKVAIKKARTVQAAHCVANTKPGKAEQQLKSKAETGDDLQYIAGS